MFEEELRDWDGCLTQDQASALLGISTRTFRRWVTSVQWFSRHDMLGKRPKSEPVSVQLQGFTPTTGEIYFGIDTRCSFAKRKREPGMRYAKKGNQ